MPKSVLLLQMMELLQNRPGLTISELAKKLGRSERTIYRYLEALAKELHISVCFEDGGYYIAERPLPSRLNLTPKEVLTTHLALTSGALQRSGIFSEHAASTWKKIESALTGDTLEAVQSNLKRSAIMTPAQNLNDLGSPAIQCITNAVEHNKQLLIDYNSHRSGNTKQFVIEPYALVFRRHNWYLIAKSHLHQRIIQLKLVRVLSAQETGESFQLPHDFSVDSFYAKSWEMWTGAQEYLVRVKFTPKVAQIIRESRRHHTQELEDTEDGGVILSAKVAGIEEIGFWVLSWGAEAEVLDPPELRASIAETAIRMVARYTKEVFAPEPISPSNERELVL